MKKNNLRTPLAELTADELIAKVASRAAVTPKIKAVLCICLILPILGIFACFTKNQTPQLQDDSTISLASSPLSAVSAKRDTISIPSGVVKANPFVPYRNIEPADALSDVPTFELVAPPEVLDEGSDAARVMDTVVSGILYDKFSPSAILNIEGNDYLVKKGDVVNNYKVLNIEKNSVTVRLGSNTFKAGIGEILTEGSVNYNDVSNLNKKFGGEKR